MIRLRLSSLTSGRSTGSAPAAANLARSHEAGPILPTALLEKAKGSTGMPKGLVFIFPSPFRSWKARTA